jgi:hypothetical protein
MDFETLQCLRRSSCPFPVEVVKAGTAKEKQYYHSGAVKYGYPILRNNKRVSEIQSITPSWRSRRRNLSRPDYRINDPVALCTRGQFASVGFVEVVLDGC